MPALRSLLRHAKAVRRRATKSTVEDWVETSPLDRSSFPPSKSCRGSNPARRYPPLPGRRDSSFKGGSRKSPLAFQEAAYRIPKEFPFQRGQIQNGDLLHPTQKTQGCHPNFERASCHLFVAGQNGTGLHLAGG